MTILIDILLIIGVLLLLYIGVIIIGLIFWVLLIANSMSGGSVSFWEALKQCLRKPEIN